MPQNKAHGGPLAQQQERTHQKEKYQRPAGHMLQPEHEQACHKADGIQRVGTEEPGRLPVEADGAVRAVQSRHGVGKQAQRHGHGGQADIIGKGDTLNAGEHIKADPVGHHHGEEHQQSVGKHVQLV